ncbi:hypothetical protein [Nonomuraea turcica]|uniref:hypothetical protein n=1 Tax=Nonomuraea sp. G32 TaxID=3067274 RepID=UPI00273AAC81|nr:hypothetical protein [Nonomuraea sp. G32]MDP4501055.1 hypothetical protein [Nonomuraea sp. G32]
MQDLGLLQAWGMWFDNVQVNQHTIYGISILGLGRVGKVVSFIAGMTVILDIIGPDRIRQFGSRHKRFEPFRSRTYMKIVIAVSLLGLIICAMIFMANRDAGPSEGASAAVGAILLAGMVLFIAPGVARAMTQVLAKGLENQAWERAIRWSAVILLAVGFHFDLLAS